MVAPHYQLLTIFPEIFESFLTTSLIKKAQDAGHIKVSVLNVRDFSDPPHHKTDDTPYGGGAGMVMRPEPLARTIEHALSVCPEAKVLLMTPSGTPLVQAHAEELSAGNDLIIICARYEGVDQRIIDLFVDEEISIGDYVLFGGEIPAMVVLEAVIRLKEHVLGNDASLGEESFSINDNGGLLLEAPHYTKPAEFRGLPVPDVLLSGNHKAIAEWRLAEARVRTARVRPDLLKKPVK